MPRVAIYARTSTDKNQTVENQLLQVNEVPPMDPARVEAIRTMLVAGTGIRETARRPGAGTTSVMRIKQTLEAHTA